jgi:amidohydrolase
MDSESLINLRKELHKKPELSGSEVDTASRIKEELEQCKPDRIIPNLGGAGIMAGFLSDSVNEATNLLFRAELDAIAVKEMNTFGYRSGNEGVMHGCGHDGHMAILIGLARYLRDHRPENSNVWLLFQPAEETGKGADRIMNDHRFREIKIDYGFALHNLPGFEEHEIVIKKGVFACASTGIELQFTGKSSHAAYPEQGINPAATIAEWVTNVESGLNGFRQQNRLNKAVCTFIRLGEHAFGISPGSGQIGFTLRSPHDHHIQNAVQVVRELTDSMRNTFQGDIAFQLVEPFSATVNHEEAVGWVVDAAKISGLNILTIDEPFPWSEDFGAFQKKFPVTLFGLGSGKKHPPLHSEKYDFNDRILDTGINIFRSITENADSKPGL